PSAGGGMGRVPPTGSRTTEAAAGSKIPAGRRVQQLVAACRKNNPFVPRRSVTRRSGPQGAHRQRRHPEAEGRGFRRGGQEHAEVEAVPESVLEEAQTP